MNISPNPIHNEILPPEMLCYEVRAQHKGAIEEGPAEEEVFLQNRQVEHKVLTTYFTNWTNENN